MKNLTNTDAQQRRSAAATAQSDEISLTLHNLTEIVKLAAFAAEARRTLAGIDNTTHYQSEMREVIRTSVSNSENWDEMEDSMGEVLTFVARQLEKVNGDFTKNLYDLAHPGRGRTESEKIGGAA